VATTSGGRGRRVGNETQPPETAQRRYVVRQDKDYALESYRDRLIANLQMPY